MTPPLNFKVGILGGGQLASMLCESAIRLGLRPVVLAKGPLDPALRLSRDTMIGDYNDPQVLSRFLREVSLVAFENEFVPSELLSASKNRDVKFVPGLQTLAKLQDKTSQKRALIQAQIPTAPMLVHTGDVRAWLDEVNAKFPQGAVLKWARTGYDGKGVSLENDDRVAFCETALQRGSVVFAEPKVPFKRELAMVACRSTTGAFATYPLVIIEQPKGICRWVKGPATALGVDAALETKATEFARRIAETFELYGTFAIELFELQTGELWVNEISPRVHNSGHFTQDAAVTSQFENHWRALLGLPLGDVSTQAAFAMLNLLGPDETKKEWHLPPITARLHLHWYGKADLLPGRKLGHINGHVRDVAEFSALIAEIEACEKNWIQQ